jgi:hypothetical protein
VCQVHGGVGAFACNCGSLHVRESRAMWFSLPQYSKLQASELMAELRKCGFLQTFLGRSCSLGHVEAVHCPCLAEPAAKAQLSLCLIKHHAMKTCGGSGGIALYILNVRLETGYRLDGRGVGVWVLVGAGFFSSPYRPDLFFGPPTVLSSLYWGLFNGIKAEEAWSWPPTQ